MISVIIPIYNTSAFLTDFLDSLYLQKQDELEIIFIDDCSTDDSLKKLEDYISSHESKASIYIIRNKENLGLPASREIGFIHSHGDYILHLDSDDWISTNYIESLYKEMLKGADVAICDYCIVYENKTEYISQLPSNDLVRNITNLINGPLAGNMWNKMFKRSFLESHEIKFSKYNQLEDLFYSIQVFANNPVVLKAKDIIYNYRVNSSSLSFSDKRIQARRKEQLQNYNEIGKILIKNHSELFENIKDVFFIRLNWLRITYLEKTKDFSRKISYYDFPYGIKYVFSKNLKRRLLSKILLLFVGLGFFYQYNLFHKITKRQ